jgi:flavin-dependent thymidylate synthase
MNVNLAGYNLDSELIKDVDSSPETISAAYARISRDPRNVDELRAESIHAIDKARKSNESIVYNMGHSSIAEHAIFNLDIIGVSRLVVEEIEKHRLCSYTEKSQRYVLFDKDYFIPIELNGFPILKQNYIDLVEEQFDVYRKLYEPLREYFVNRQDLTDMPLTAREGLAKEDARYVISLATQTQLGMTINSRNLEYLIRKLNETDIIECHLLADQLFKAVQPLVPSLIKYIEPDGSKLIMKNELQNLIYKLSEKYQTQQEYNTCKLIESTPDMDLVILESLLYSYGYKLSSENFRDILQNTTTENFKEIFNIIFKNMSEHDAMPRDFERVNFTFNLEISASCYAQLKRHRMCTLIPQNYDPSLGFVIPPSLHVIGVPDSYYNIMTKSRQVYEIMPPSVQNYILTNAHMRRVQLTINLRALYHLFNLRLDKHAQWDIRQIANKMLDCIRDTHRDTQSLKLLCGKDKFEKQKMNYLHENT